MILNIIFRTSDYRGDHSAEVGLAYEANPEETLGELVNRIRTTTKWKLGDFIEIRVVEE